jgi:hypothetical protein
MKSTAIGSSLNFIYSLDFDRIKFNLIPIDSSLNALQIFFWVELDWSKNSAAN